MADNLPTVWPAELHTCAKHAILERYLKAWFPILAQQSRRVARRTEQVLFVDGFAGPGEYTDGEPGSPVIALNTVLGHRVAFPVPIQLLFIEENQERYARLATILKTYQDRIGGRDDVFVTHQQGECDGVLSEILDMREKQGTHFGPALAFLDQFGYSAVSMKLIARVLAFPQCEVFSYLHYQGMNRWITDPSKASGFDRAWGGSEWRQAVDLPEMERRVHLLESYKAALRERAGAKYVWSFLMFDKNDCPLYWLIFSTNNLRGLEEMKKAMWTVDKTGGFKFSDRDDPCQLALLDQAYDKEWLANDLAKRLAGRTMTIAQIKEHVLVSTPCHLFKGALKHLEQKKNPVIRALAAPANRRPGTYPDDDLERISVRFREAELF